MLSSIKTYEGTQNEYAEEKDGGREDDDAMLGLW